MYAFEIVHRKKGWYAKFLNGYPITILREKLLVLIILKRFQCGCSIDKKVKNMVSTWSH